MTRCKMFMVEERSSLARCYSEFLSNEDVEIIVISSGSEATKYFAQDHEPNLILLDLQLGDMDGLELLSYILAKSPKSAVVVITSNGSFEMSRKVMNMGAIDYLEKPFTRDRLCVTMNNARKHLELEKATSVFGDQFCGFVGSSLPMQAVYRIIQSAATSSKASVFITGESGTGKEVCSQAIHDLSPRSGNECVILNCAAIPKDLIESEIFGHIKGAFTGAVSNREGAATRAHNGTLFLDEIGEMDMDLQSKLLRFVQTGKFNKVGSSTVETVDVRFICATNRDPLTEIANNRFREDLYYRLNVIPINLPPLRDRGKDIITIAEHYLRIFAEEEGKAFTSLSNKTKEVFLEYSWPGNVRQLLNVVRNIVVLNSGVIVEDVMLPAPFNQSANHMLSQAAAAHSHRSPGNNNQHANYANNNGHFNNVSPLRHAQPIDAQNVDASPILDATYGVRQREESPESICPLWQVEMETIDRALRICNGNITQAAKLLEINPSTIHRKRQSWQKNGFV